MAFFLLQLLELWCVLISLNLKLLNKVYLQFLKHTHLSRIYAFWEISRCICTMVAKIYCTIFCKIGAGAIIGCSRPPCWTQVLRIAKQIRNTIFNTFEDWYFTILINKDWYSILSQSSGPIWVKTSAVGK